MAIKRAVAAATKTVAAKKAVKPTFKAPKTLALAADRVYVVREERLGKERGIKPVVEALKAEEAFLREYLIEKLPVGEASGIAGKLARVSINRGTVPVADDWDKIYGHIVDTVIAARKKKSPTPYGIFALLGRSLNSEAVKEMWEAGVAIPGVGKFNTKSLSLSKL